MPPTPGRHQRRTQPRQWSALDTPVGFERCVRETLRELYGYVALLAGRDRAAAEALVADVYRSLFRAVGAGDVESVTLGALRSAARQAWLVARRDDLISTDEVSRAPAATIADLSPLERAVLVLRHVNGMSPAQAAVELGRTDREVAAVGAHAVRRLRGTDDTSGAWLRAYLGPSVTPAGGLVDRIVDRLADLPAPTDATETEATEPEAAEPDAAPEVHEPAGMATTELAVVDRPTVEVPVLAGGPAGGDPIEPLLVPLPPGAPPEPAERPGRPRWALVVALVLLAALAAALIWLVVRGDTGDTVVSTPTPDAAGPVEAGVEPVGGPRHPPGPGFRGGVVRA